jgi:hypothetical protein
MLIAYLQLAITIVALTKQQHARSHGRVRTRGTLPYRHLPRIGHIDHQPVA